MTALRAAEPPTTSATGSKAPSLGAASHARTGDMRAASLQAPSMRICRTIAELREQLRAARDAGLTVGFVPTMGALHAGHLSLIEAARRRCGLVVVSVFVNPAQFDEQADLERYPRAEARDAALAQSAGADLLFAPSPEEIYPPGFATTVEVRGLTDRLEGAVRGSAHFRGVTTVVCKLLNVVAPDVAFFGQKDAQQAAVIRRMVADLQIDVQIETLPTVRESDGLAMSSRNARLSASERGRALALHAALTAAERLAAAGERSAERLIEAARETLSAHEVRPDYVALVDPHGFDDLDRVADAALMLLAARIGETRLIDNAVLRVAAEGDGPRDDGRREGKGRKRHYLEGDGPEPAPHHDIEDPRPDRGEVIAPCSA